jgi:hypothetical protein
MGERGPAPTDLRAPAARKAERRRSRIILAAIIVVSFVVPIAATALFIGSDRVRGYAILALALVLVGAGFLALFQRPIPKSQSSWTEPSAGPPGTGTYG